jgi:hypothetical protein
MASLFYSNNIKLSKTSSECSSISNYSDDSTKILINLNEKDIIKLILEFLANRQLNIAMLDLEREAGVINETYADDIVFLRQLILDGRWEDAIEFVQPLQTMHSFDAKHCRFLLLKYQLIELVWLKYEALNELEYKEKSVNQLETHLNKLRASAPSEYEYAKLSALASSASCLHEQSEYAFWNPCINRLECFEKIYPLVEKFLMNEKCIDDRESTSSTQLIAQNERLVQLIVKGLLYENCVEYCQARATNSAETYNLSSPNCLLMPMQLSETDASLLSWLHSLSTDTFSCPFEEKPLKINIENLLKPSLECKWSDLILCAPFKSQQRTLSYASLPDNSYCQIASKLNGHSHSLKPTKPSLSITSKPQNQDTSDRAKRDSSYSPHSNRRSHKMVTLNDIKEEETSMQQSSPSPSPSPRNNIQSKALSTWTYEMNGAAINGVSESYAQMKIELSDKHTIRALEASESEKLDERDERDERELQQNHENLLSSQATANINNNSNLLNSANSISSASVNSSINSTAICQETIHKMSNKFNGGSSHLQQAKDENKNETYDIAENKDYLCNGNGSSEIPKLNTIEVN